MATARIFEELECWKESRELVKMVFKACEIGKLSKDFGTSNQIKRAAVSVMNNIAEGHGRRSTKEFIRFLDFAQSSSLEVKSMTYILVDLDYLSEESCITIRHKSEQVKKMIRGLMHYLDTYNINSRTQNLEPASRG